MRSKRVAGLLVVAVAGIGIASPTAGAASAVDIIFASDFVSGSALQWVRRHPQAGGHTIVLAPALVSAVMVSNGGADTTLYLQVPPALNHETTYPAFSALKAFGPANASTPAIGDCVIVQGTIAQFHGATELSPAIVTATAGADCGGSPLAPYSTTVADIATDTDSSTFSTYQPGPLAEDFESALVTLDVHVLGTPQQGGYKVVDTAGVFNPPYLFVGNFLYASAPPSSAHVQITGVYDEYDDFIAPSTIWYLLLPRSASDVVVLP